MKGELKASKQNLGIDKLEKEIEDILSEFESE